MKAFFRSHHPVRHAKSFKYAFEGVLHALLNEANFRIQLVIVAASIFLGLHFNISNVEWGLLVISLGALLSAEMINTVIEEFIDNFIKQENFALKVIKDLSAGFVLVTSVSTLIILFLIFGNRLF